ncbi:pyridoxal phosphate-dependent decarboxylase family protein [Kaarinaea lacus]
MHTDKADCGNITPLLTQMGEYLDQYQCFEHGDAMQHPERWRDALNQPVPREGVGIAKVMEEIGMNIIPNASQIPNPGCTSFITTGATNAGVLATLAGSVASPQRIGLTAFNYLEELSLEWLADMFELPKDMKGVYSSGGSVANLVALGAARQWAFERQGIDPAAQGVTRPCRIYVTAACHHTVHRAAAVLGMGRDSVITIASDSEGRMLPNVLMKQLDRDNNSDAIPVAVVANAGTTGTGAIDPLKLVGQLAKEYGIWFHVDGAYGLPGILDPELHHLYEGLELADSVIVDPHKWLGAPVGIGATFVRDRSILHRAFTQQASDYLEGSFTDTRAEHSMDNAGIPYYDFGVELSAPSRGAVVWALIREIGMDGLRERVTRHNAMARYVARQAEEHPNLEVVQQPTLSICCVRYVHDDWTDLDFLNQIVHRRMVQKGRSIPSTTVVNGKLAIRPCFIGARTSWQQAKEFIEELISTGKEVIDSVCPVPELLLTGRQG